MREGDTSLNYTCLSIVSSAIFPPLSYCLPQFFYSNFPLPPSFALSFTSSPSYLLLLSFPFLLFDFFVFSLPPHFSSLSFSPVHWHLTCICIIWPYNEHT